MTGSIDTATNPDSAKDQPKDAEQNLYGAVRSRLGKFSDRISAMVRETPLAEAAKEDIPVSTEETTVKQMLYIYCVTNADAPEDYGRIGVGGANSEVYTIKYKDIAAVVSDISDGPLENTEKNVLAHQRVMQRVFEKAVGVPVVFSTVVDGPEEAIALLTENYSAYADKLVKLKRTADLAKSNGSSSEAKSGDMILKVLDQSAESAVKIRGLSADGGDGKSDGKVGEEAMAERVADIVLSKLARVLAEPTGMGHDVIKILQDGSGRVQRPTTPSSQQVKTQADEIQNINKRLDDLSKQLTLSEQLNVILADNRKRLDDQYGKLEKLSEALADRAATKAAQAAIEDGRQALEGIVQNTLQDYFKTVPPSIRSYIEQTVDTYVKNTVVKGKKEVTLRMLCTTCGAALPTGVRFCDRCGTEASGALTPHCSSCGAELQSVDKFCYRCGTKPD